MRFRSFGHVCRTQAQLADVPKTDGILFPSAVSLSLTVWVLDASFSYFYSCSNCFLTFSNICFDIVYLLPVLSSLIFIYFLLVPHSSDC